MNDEQQRSRGFLIRQKEAENAIGAQCEAKKSPGGGGSSNHFGGQDERPDCDAFGAEAALRCDCQSRDCHGKESSFFPADFFLTHTVKLRQCVCITG